MSYQNDLHHMKSALSLARQGLGQTWPNPSVGCVIVKDGVIVGRARTANCGRPHAETQALTLAGAAAKGACVYVTLEPCSHYGKTGPCAEALARAGVARVVIAALDPDQRVCGQGIEILKQNGIKTDVGLCHNEAEEVLRGHIYRVTKNRPFVTMKIATTLDAKMAMKSGESQWITGAFARQTGRFERALHDGVITGIETVLNDNPGFTSRLQGFNAEPVRVVFDTHLRFPNRNQMLDTLSTAPLWIVTVSEDEEKMNRFRTLGVEIIHIQKNENGHIDIQQALTKLAERGLTRIMIEAGPTLTTAFLREGLCDRLLWFRAPTILGDENLSVFGEMGFEKLAQRLNLKRVETRSLDTDLLEIYERNA